MALPDHLQKLLAECEVTPFKSSGPGGQKKNKTESSVRVKHLPTGLIRISTESRSQIRNREAALQRVFDTLEARKRKPKPRLATRPSRAAKERRVETKRRTSVIKRQRSRPESGE